MRISDWSSDVCSSDLYDLYVPIVKSSQQYPIADGEKLMLDAVKPLGSDYVAAMRKGVNSRWMDVYPRPHKTSGAHMAGNAYDVHPRSEERRVGKEWVSTCSIRWSAHY